MAKKRASIPKATGNAVLKEYRHKCAMCGRHTPQLHHIDQDPSNNEGQNLIPLCPNCHLQDIHDPTRPPDRAKLRLFRKYKDPLILDARFHPIFTRMRFLYKDPIWVRTNRFQYFEVELLAFIKVLSMGSFYEDKIRAHLENIDGVYALKLLDEGHLTCEMRFAEATVATSPELHAQAHQFCTEAIEALLVELLRFQGWIAAPFTQQ